MCRQLAILAFCCKKAIINKVYCESYFVKKEVGVTRKIIFLFLLFSTSNVLLWAAIPGDINGNGIVDLQDVVILSEQWLGTPAASADIAPLPYGDGSINLLDFGELASHWMATLPDPNEMVFITGGEFQMGDAFNDATTEYELPVHSVKIDSFYIGKYEITNSQYCEFLNAELTSDLIYVDPNTKNIKNIDNDLIYCSTSLNNPPSQIEYNNGTFIVLSKNGRNMDNDPITLVSWYGAAAYCNWRSKQANYHTCYDPITWQCDFTKKGYRLPTEAEWEYAARGGFASRRFSWADPNTISHNQANYKADSDFYVYDVSDTTGYHPDWNDGIEPYTSPVGSFPENGYGLYDMTGNAFEWCNDWFDASYYEISSFNNPTGPESSPYTPTRNVLRGGSWYDTADRCRVSYRYSWPTNNTRPGIGFRINLDLN